MTEVIRAIRGMNDILPPEIAFWQQLEAILKEVAASYGYHEIRLPVIEKTQLFKRSIGEVTDIIEKEMYTFADRNDESLSLRPEATASCVRAGLEHGLIQNQQQRWWYIGPMFRYERPQHGRYRMFYQFGLEAYGLSGPDIDAEILVLCARLWKRLGIENFLELKLNSLGTVAARKQYRQVLIDFFTKHFADLDNDSQRRLHTNPLRILDSKNPAMQSLIHAAPRLNDYLDEESRLHFEQLQQMLQQAGIKFTLDPTLVRGLDYYTKTVFEWQTSVLGSQNTVCAGGRYDDLVEQIGGPATPAAGFALGIERLLSVWMQARPTLTTEINTSLADVYLILQEPQFHAELSRIAEQLRDAIPSLRIVQHCGVSTMKNQFKRADKSGARYAVILGEAESQSHKVTVKNLRVESTQQLLSVTELIDYLKSSI